MTTKNSKTSILSLVDTKKDEIVSLASKLVQIPSVNPPADMTEIAGFITDFLKFKCNSPSYKEQKIFTHCNCIIMFRTVNTFISSISR